MQPAPFGPSRHPPLEVLQEAPSLNSKESGRDKHFKGQLKDVPMTAFICDSTNDLQSRQRIMKIKVVT